MSAGKNRHSRPDFVLLDIETQRDFFLPRGSCYTSRATVTRDNILRLFKWARKKDFFVISTVLRQLPGCTGLLVPDRPHCIEGTPGERKVPGTLIRPFTDLGMQNGTDLPVDVFDRFRQVIFEKRYSTDIFEHARSERLIDELQKTCFILCGAGLSGGIVKAAIGLRFRGFPVILARDAALGLTNRIDGAMRRMYAKGVEFATTSKIVDASEACVFLTSVLPHLRNVRQRGKVDRKKAARVDHGLSRGKGA